VRVLPGRERVLFFVNREKSSPLLQKAIPEMEKRKERHNTQNII